MIYSRHAREQMAKRGIMEAEVVETIRSYHTQVPGRSGCVNRFRTFGSYKIRVTLDPTQTKIVTNVQGPLRPMKPLLSVSRDPDDPYPIYLCYSNAKIASQESLDGDLHSVNVDRDVDGNVVGVEIVAPDDESVDLVAQFAHENGLSLAGVFVPAFVNS